MDLCVCEREREREREKSTRGISLVRIMLSSIMVANISFAGLTL